MTTSVRPSDWTASLVHELEDALSSMDEHVFMLDERGCYRYLNARVAEALDRPARELLGRCIWELFPHLIGTRFHTAVQATTADRKVRQLETFDENRDCWFENSIYPAGAGTAVIVRDISRRKRAEEAALRSEEQLRQLTDSIPALIWSAGPDGSLEYCNRRLLDYAGLMLDQVQGESWLSALHPDDVERTREVWLQAVAAGQEYEHVFRLRHALLGQYRWFLVRGQPLKDEQGRVIRWFGICTDIEEHKRAEEARRRSEQLLAHSQAIAHVGSYVVDIVDPNDRSRDRTIWSNEMRRIYGLESADLEVRAEMVFSRVHPADRERLATVVEQAFRTLRPFEIEYRIVRPDGERVLRGWGQFDLDETGRPVRLWGTTQDITEQKRMANALQEADRRKNEFLATLAHELRNPLAPIRHAMKIARMPNAGETQRQWAYEVTERQIGQMARLLDDLLEASRISRGKVELRKERTNLIAALNTAIEATQPLIETKHHVLTVDMPDFPVWLEADPVRLTQIFTNLVANAAKYTDPRGRIAVVAAVEGDHVTITVRDNGIGIAPEMLPRIFHLFSQVHSALERAEGGLGIGLALARGLVELHGGSIEAHSAGPGTGSEFVVRLPIKGVGAGEITPAAQPPVHEDGRRRRVLVADDNRDSAESLAMMLRLQGHEVEVAHDGRQALTIASIFHPHIVLLDIGMPELNGYEVARQIRAERWGQNMALVAVTGWGQEEDKRRAVEAGIDLHLTKPIDPDRLEALFQNLEKSQSTPRPDKTFHG